jgi:hypothetical protein
MNAPIVQKEIGAERLSRLIQNSRTTFNDEPKNDSN